MPETAAPARLTQRSGAKLAAGESRFFIHAITRIVVAAGVLLIVGGVTTPPAAAEIYKWVDEHGKVHFGDKPPTSGVTPETVNVSPATGNGGSSPSDSMRRERQQRLLNDYAQQREDRKIEQAKRKADEEERKRRCLQAKDNLRTMRDASYLYDLDDNGERVIHSRESRAKMEQETAALIAKHCK